MMQDCFYGVIQKILRKYLILDMYISRIDILLFSPFYLFCVKSWHACAVKPNPLNTMSHVDWMSWYFIYALVNNFSNPSLPDTIWNVYPSHCDYVMWELLHCVAEICNLYSKLRREKVIEAIRGKREWENENKL